MRRPYDTPNGKLPRERQRLRYTELIEEVGDLAVKVNKLYWERGQLQEAIDFLHEENRVLLKFCNTLQETLEELTIELEKRGWVTPTPPLETSL